MAARTFTLPGSYADLPVEHIRIANHPPTAAGVTPIQVVTLYRPGAHNAFTGTMMDDIERAWTLFDLDDRVKAIVVTGHGRMFCAGADLNTGFRRYDDDINGHRDSGGRVTLAIHRCSKPTIGAIQGPAVGVGITMTLPMTIRIAHKDAKVGFVFARRGLVMEAASSFFLPRLIGMSRSLHLVSTGAVYPASHRLLDGLFSELLDTPEQVLPRAIEIANEIVDNCSGVALTLMRDLMYRGTESAEAQHLLDSRILYSLFQGKDNKEGVAAFMEKRKVNFTGTMQKDAPSAYPWWQAVDTTAPNKVADAKSKL